MGLILKCPLSSAAHTQPDGHEIGGKSDRNCKESDDAAQLCATGEFIEEDEAQKDHYQHPPLRKGICPVNLEKHR